MSQMGRSRERTSVRQIRSMRKTVVGIFEADEEASPTLGPLASLTSAGNINYGLTGRITL
jgi:hypothetical protein